jgi:type I restriction enzyme M protein
LPHAVATDSNGDAVSLRSAWDSVAERWPCFWQQMDALVETLDGLIAEDIERV